MDGSLPTPPPAGEFAPASAAAPTSQRQRSTTPPCWSQIGTWGKRDCPELPAHGHCRNCPTYAAAAARMLDGPVPDGYVEAWTRHFARAKPELPRDTQSAVVFRLRAEWFGLPVPVLSEVVERRPVHSLPHTRAAFIKGVVNVRGQLLICISLSCLLRLPEPGATLPAPQTTFERLLVVRTDGAPLVFPVSEVLGLWRYRPSDVRPVPATVARGSGRFTNALLRWQPGTTAHALPSNSFVGLLDEQLLLRAITRGLA